MKVFLKRMLPHYSEWNSSSSVRIRFCSILLVTVLIGLPSALSAQTTGTISGFVKDQSGAVVPSAKVTATLVQQHTVRTVETNPNGFYIFNALPPGEYTLTAEKAGFERLVRSGISLALNQNLRVDFGLRLGRVSQEVTVSGQASLVDTRSGALSDLVDDRRVVDLPLNGRNVIGLAAILPGVVSVNAPQGLTDARSGPTMNVNGSLDNQNMFTFNGGIFVNPSRETGMNYPPPDAVKQFSIQALDFSAEYGRNAGSHVNVVSKSGTNQFHGTAWEFLRNDALNARNFFSATVPPHKQNQYGADAGGPIIRNKLFIFGSYQGTQDHTGALSHNITVPSAQERNGDFTGLGTTLNDPVDALTGQPLTDSTGALCVQNNIVRSGCISQLAKTLSPLIPQSASGKLTTFGSEPMTDNNFLARGDWNQSSKNTVSATTYVDHNFLQYLNIRSGSIPGYMTGHLVEQTTMAALNDTYSFSPSLLNQLNVTFLRTTSQSTSDKIVDPTSMGVNSPLYAEAGAIAVNVGDLFSFGSHGLTGFTNNNMEFRNVTTWIRNKHTIKFGGEWLHLHFRQIFLGDPSLTFNGSRSGNEFADFLLGSFYDYHGGFGVRTNDDFQEAPSLFFEDQFQVIPRFTLTYGIRWEPFFPWYDRYNRLESLAGITTGAQSTLFPDAPPGILFAGDPGIPRGVSPTRWKYFAPRFGFAWDVFGDGRTSVRGGYGIFFDSVKADAVSQESAPWAGYFDTYNGLASDPFGSVGQTAPPVSPTAFACVKTSSFPGVECPLYPLPINGVLTGSNLMSPYIQAWNLTIQRQIARTWMVQAGYVGKAAIHVDGWQNFNPGLYMNDPVTGAPPSLQNVNDRTVFLPGILGPDSIALMNSFRSWYNGLQLQVTKRVSHGLALNAAYTYSKSIDDISTNWNDHAVCNPVDLRACKGPSDYDRTHVFVASWLWSPVWKFHNGLQNGLLGNWTFAALHTVASGAPFSVLEGEDVALDGTSGGAQHAELKPGAVVTRSWANEADMLNEYFNTAAFVPPSQVPPGTYGNSGRNILRRPAQNITNFSAIKNFKLKERLHLQFRAEFFNLFNHPNFGSSDTIGGSNDPVNNADSSAFGQIRTAGAAREIQFALKLFW